MRIAVTGRNGQIARSLRERGPKAGHEIVTLARPFLDLASDPNSIIAAVEAARPELIVSAAAYTAVDRAERERELAFAINESGAAAIARAAKMLSVPLVHLSTDYVFGGDKPSPYAEADKAAPLSVYGASKLAGERAVMAAHDDVTILRTAWIYSPFGLNFATKILRLAREVAEIPVVSDRLGNPTSALDVADAILTVASNLSASNDPSRRGIFHMAATGEASWAEFAESLLSASGLEGSPVASIKRIRSSEYSAQARRPANSQLDCTKLSQIHGVKLPPWPDSLPEVVKRILQNAETDLNR